MYLHRAISLSFSCLLLAAGCRQISIDNSTDKAPPEVAVRQDVGEVEAGVRIASANKRIAELERQVTELQLNPEKLNLDLLTSRVTALEAKTYGSDEPLKVVDPIIIPKEKPNPKAPSRASNSRQTVPKIGSKLKPPEAEKRVRLAIPDEVKEFSRGK